MDKKKNSRTAAKDAKKDTSADESDEYISKQTDMPPPSPPKPQPRIAVIGGGVSGLAAAWHLQQVAGYENNVHLFESKATLGGHACTVPIVDSIPVDVGFMVFNHANYPNMVEWFRALKVKEEDSDMSLAVSLTQDDDDSDEQRKTFIEWSSRGLKGFMGAHPWQWLRPSFYMFLADMLRFHRQAPAFLQLHPDDPRRQITTEQYLRQNNYSQAFADYYLLPMMAALWSASLGSVLTFPAVQLIAFLCHHQMLQVGNRPVWKTVAGRSASYTTKVGLRHVQTGRTVTKVQGDATGYRLTTTRTAAEEEDGFVSDEGDATTTEGPFDHVIFACHPPDARRMLAPGSIDASLDRTLAKIKYEGNDIFVHSDISLMPSSRAAWASWNCLGRMEDLPRLGGGKKSGDNVMEGSDSGFGNRLGDDNKNHTSKKKAVYVTYHLNRLQNLPSTAPDIFVTLNPPYKPAAIHHHMQDWSHPQFTTSTLAARDRLRGNHDGLWFCGAWMGFGFHEDGCRSGLEVATQISGVPVPWAKDSSQMVLPPPDLTPRLNEASWWTRLYHTITYAWPVAVCKPLIVYFLEKAICHGTLRVKCNDGSILSFGDGSPCGRGDQEPVTLRVFDDWFFVKTAFEYDLGLARSYMAGYFVVEPLEDESKYHPVMRPKGSRNETNAVLGDPVGLTRLFLLFVGNRDDSHTPRKAGRGGYAHAMTNASGLFLSKVGSFMNYVRYKLTMNNSERGGSLRNIHAHYDISNDLFRTFLDKETLMYSSAIYDAIKAPGPTDGLVFRGSLEQAQWRKLDTLLDRAQVQPGQTLLDIGFGWGGLSLHAAKKYGCSVTGITLSVEQKALAEQRVRDQGLGSLITFEVVDYRTFCRRKENQGKFDRVLSCEMIEAVGHAHLGEFFWAVEQVLSHDGALVMEAITTPEQRYDTYVRSTDFINTVIFPGSCCPSLHALIDAAYQNSCLTLEHIDNIGLHYAETLAEWRRRFNAKASAVRAMKFDDIFLRCWNYYLTYCEAGFFSQTENCLILVFSRQGCSSLVPLCETRSIVQNAPFTDAEKEAWLQHST